MKKILLFIVIIFLFTSCGEQEKKEAKTKEEIENYSISCVKHFLEELHDGDDDARKRCVVYEVGKNDSTTLYDAAKSMNVDYQDLSRVTPMKNFAIKYDLDYAISKIIDIEWSMSGTILSPVAIIEPVELNGATVQRASLHNVNKMEELGVEIGKSAMITRRGEIIPKVEKIID